MIVQKRDGWLAAKIDNELVMMNAANNNYIGLSEVGARIWELIETPQDLDAICARLLEEYDVSYASCRSAVEAFLDRLAGHGAVTLDPPSRST